MGIGNLTVSVTAETRQARAELAMLRQSIKDTDSAAARVNLHKLEVPEIGRNFYWPKEEVQGALRETEQWRSAVVDLTQDTSRYNRDLKAQLPLLKNLEKSFKAVKSIGKIFLVAEAFKLGFDFGQRLGSSLSKGFEGALKDAKGWLEGLLDPGLVEVRAKKEEAARQQRIKAQEKAQADKERERQAEVDFQKRLAEAELDRREAMGFKVDRQFGADKEQFGVDRAIELQQKRVEAERLAAIEADKKLAAEEQIAALKERTQKWEEAQEKARQNRLEDAKTVADLAREAGQLGMSDARKRRENTLAGIEDPGQRAAAARQLNKIQAFERGKARADAAREDADAIRGRGPAKTLDARTAEGWAALRDSVRNGPQQQLVKQGERQVAALAQTNALLTRIADRGSDEDFDF